jgi:hypothetical protein
MTYRQIHVEIWDDPWVIELPSDHKLLFIYLFSNSRTNAIGLYEIAPRVIGFETGLPTDTIQAALDQFTAMGKVKFCDNWVWVPKLITRNITNMRSPKVQKMIERQIRDIPDSCPFKAEWIQHYNDIICPQYGIDTISVGYSQSQIPSVPVPVPVSDSVSVSESVSVAESALDAYVKIRGGAVNPLDVEQIAALVDELEAHRASLPPGATGSERTGEQWVKDAILEANASRRDGPVNLNYIKAIIDRWRTEGHHAKRGSVVKVSGL